MSGTLSSAAQHVGEELVLDSFLSSTVVEDRGGTNEASFQIAGFLHFQRPLRNALTTLPVVAAIMFLLLVIHFCGLGKSDESGLRGRSRRLSGKEGEEGGKDASSRTEDVCGMVEQAVSSQGAAPTAPSGPPPAAAEAVSEKERLQKRKRKASWLEEGRAPAPRLAKEAKEGAPSSPPGSFADEEKSMAKVVEEVVIEALESVGPNVEDWDLEFSEESLWMSPPAVTPEVPQEGSGVPEGSPGADKNLRLRLQAAKQLQGEQQQSASLESSEGGALFAGFSPFLPVGLFLSKPHPGKGEGLPRGEGVPSTSRVSPPTKEQGPVPSPTPRHIESHRFYRIPPAASHAPLPLFDGNLPLANESQPKELSKWLATVRQVLAKNALSIDDLTTLKDTAYFLLHHASQWSPAELEKLKPGRSAERAARRFLVADALWCICAVGGPAMNRTQWWDRFLAHATIPEIDGEDYPFKVAGDWRPMVRRLRKAMEVYRQGRRPEAEEIVSLKRAIFCDPRFHYRFRSHSWDSWRQDDEDFKRGSGAS